MSGHGRIRTPPNTGPMFRGTTKLTNAGKQRTPVKDLPRNNTLKAGLQASALEAGTSITVVNNNKLKNDKNYLTPDRKKGLETMTGMDVDADVESSGSGSFILVNGKRTKKI